MEILTVVLLLGILILLFAVSFLVLKSRRRESDSAETERLRQEIKELKAEHSNEARANREEIARSIGEMNRSLHSQITEMNASQLRQVSEMNRANEEIAERLRVTVDGKLSEMSRNNEKKLEEMRHTVDEKLENTLNQRIGESFGLVNDRLEKVNKSLGEMQSLSSEITDMKRIFSNVKSRGVWGEVQLSAILEEILTSEQYVANYSTGAKSTERVEFAVCLPGRDDLHSVVYLPIDSKFPVEDYQRLVTAEENCDTTAAGECRKALERTLKSEAKMIRDKYIEPPKTLDYGIMFLPTEGLYSEALRLPDFMEFAAKQRVMVTGPTNLAALLNALKMGFKTLAIEEKSGEIRMLLGKVKTDLAKFADSLAKAQKKIQEADKYIGEADHRTELLTKKLKNVEIGVNEEGQLPSDRIDVGNE